MLKTTLHQRSVPLLFGIAVTASALALGIAFAPTPAAAFVCGGSATGAEPQTGGGATAGGNATACGLGATATGVSSTALGGSGGVGSAQATSTGAIAVGTNANAGTAPAGFISDITPHVGPLAPIAMGVNATATGNFAVAVGSNLLVDTGALNVTAATGANSVALGGGASAGGIIGFVGGNGFTNAGTTALGAHSQAGATGADQTNATAVGFSAQANAASGTALGAGATVNFANSTAIGSGASTAAANQISIGTSSNIYRMPGITSVASLSAQSGALSLVTSDSGGNLAIASAASLGLATSSQVNSLSSQVSALSAQIGDVKSEARRGIAATAAMAYAPTPSAPGRTPSRSMAVFTVIQGALALPSNIA
jgi:hypothetical protein